MHQINWNQFKFYKQERASQKGMDNFQLLIEFIRGYYHIVNLDDIFDMLAEDDLSCQMLEKREIKNSLDLENYLYRLQLSLK